MADRRNTTVWKYSLPVPGEEARLGLRVGAELVHMGPDPSGSIAVWYELNPIAPIKWWCFEIIGTGHQIPQDSQHIGSYVAGPFVWHVYRTLVKDVA